MAHSKLKYNVDLEKLTAESPGHFIVYCIKHVHNNKVYIGQTKQALLTRIRAHQKRPVRKMRKDVQALQKTSETWTDVFKSKREANAVETKMIREFQSHTALGYNDPLMVGDPFCKGMYQQMYQRT
ncbi:hypothetical protein PSENEW3n2_00000921 [Picochlorum sp. SENEW3]|nr:hypothetical protein PSENEW3n2_00000921 [Picochlorum sp. SENEW3]WPT14977.1 hypothetical protein PSENEW3_00000921 [Picochlorum sp. SENEW3]